MLKRPDYDEASGEADAELDAGDEDDAAMDEAQPDVKSEDEFENMPPGKKPDRKASKRKNFDDTSEDE